MTQKQSVQVALVSLGCPKNLVDSEYMADAMRGDGMLLVQDPAEADVIIVNTCGFIESAKKEAIDTILDMADYKQGGRCRHLVVTGCLAQRYPGEIEDNLPEVDAILGVGAYGEIVKTIHSLIETCPEGREENGEVRALCETRRGHTTDHFQKYRTASTGSFAYLKIAEGCSNRCAYCAIPGIRGRMISRPIEDIIEEAKSLLAGGAREIVLVAQDTTAYGMDLYRERRLPALLEELCALPGDFDVRLLYCYSDGMTDELLDTIARLPKVVPYMDMPIQHGSDTVLQRMGRKDTAAGIREVVHKWRSRIPKIIFRTTVMVGFPGETEEEFEELMDLIRELKFPRLGCFVFSPEEGTKAWTMPDAVPAEVSQARYEKLMEEQQKISAEFNRSRLGECCRVSLESVSEDGIFYLGRSYAESPDIDPLIYVLAGDEPLEGLPRIWVRIIEADAYDLTAVTCSAPGSEGEESGEKEQPL